MRNYWFFLIAKALVQQGWDESDINKRPYVWVRGMTAGAQRYATLWSGDTYPSYSDMQKQIRAMQLAGLSGFPYWGHDAGGFYDWEKGLGTDDQLYIQWAMAFGSFAPVWKPHGMGQSRWPLDRPEAVQEHARKFMRLRYELMPYLYSYAHVAANTGTPLARAMALEYQDLHEAWKHDQQYLWGDFLLIAPNATEENTIDVWLPPGKWYDFESKAVVNGDRVISVDAGIGTLPIFVKAGAVIPRREFALSTAFIDKGKLIVDVYAGGSATSISVIEDDEVTDAYREDEFSVTRIDYEPLQKVVRIETTDNQPNFAPHNREYVVNIYGSNDFDCAEIDGERVSGERSGESTIYRIASRSSTRPVHIRACSTRPLF
jgi:alpha-D-xyloside xylohydrolase